MSCGWPFHHDPECVECKQWEQKYGENMTAWLDQRAEVREAAKAQRRAARDARLKTMPPTPSA